MPNIIKTEYMGRPTIGYSEYFAKSANDLPTNPKPGDRALLINGDLYFCIEAGSWLKYGEKPPIQSNPAPGPIDAW